jgi:hypothetical protein
MKYLAAQSIIELFPYGGLLRQALEVEKWP